MAAAQAVEAVEEELVYLQKTLAESDSARAAARQQLNEADMRRQRADRRLQDVQQQIEMAKQSALAPEVVSGAEERSAAAEEAMNAARAAFVARQPMGRLGTPEEIAALAVYLSSDDAQFITGQAIVIDGGLTL